MTLSKLILKYAGTTFATRKFRDLIIDRIDKLHINGFIEDSRIELFVRGKYTSDSKYLTKIKNYLLYKYQIEFIIFWKVNRMPPNYIYRFKMHDRLYKSYKSTKKLIDEYLDKLHKLDI